MKKRWIAAIMCCTLIIGTGCADTPADTKPQPEPGITETTEPKQPDAEEKPDGQETQEGQSKMEDLQLVNVTTGDAYDKAAYFLDMTYKGNGPKNTLVSPLSLDMALGLVSGGAEGKTREELSAFLSKEDYGQFAADYMAFTKQLNYEYQDDYSGGYKTVFEIANSVWVDEKRELVSSYAEQARKNYQAEIASVRFDAEHRSNTVETINNWCDEKTHGLIPSIITEDAITEVLAMILVNSLYFEAPWAEKWSVMPERFTDMDGTESTQDMLRDTLSVYYENDRATGFYKPYMNGLGFIGILPKQTGDFEVRDLDLRSLLESENMDVDVHALMPKLHFETTAGQIVPILKSQGVETPFDVETADFSGLVRMNAGENTYISDILQRCRIELDENGTKAAAVTAVMMECAGAPMERERKEVYLNRPFAFMIYDRENDQIVFIGKVVSATEGMNE